MSISRNANDVQDALQIVIAEKLNFEFAFPFLVSQLHLRAEAFAEFVFEVLDVGIYGNSDLLRANLLLNDTLLLLHLADEVLGSANAKGILENSFRSEVLFNRRVERENGFGMTDSEAAFPKMRLDFGGKPEQAQRIRHPRAALADFSCDVLLPKIKPSDQLGITLSFLHRIEVFALKILDEGEFQDGAVVGFANDNRGFLKADQLGGAPAAFASDQFIMIASMPNKQRLDDSLGFDRFSQFLQTFGRKFLSRLKRRGTYTVQRHADHALAGFWSRFRAECGRLRRHRDALLAAEQCSKSST